MASQIIFALLLASGIFLFTKNVRKIIRNIRLGKDLDRSDRKKKRWMTMIRVALGQSKMVVRPVAGIMHIFVYVGFVIINIEVLEILIDGVLGTHRIFVRVLGSFYGFLISSFEVLAFLVIVGCITFLVRRNILRIKRFWNKEMTSWPRTDANVILITEILLMVAFLTMNGADTLLQCREIAPYKMKVAGDITCNCLWTPIISGFTSIPFMYEANDSTLILIERICWWFHITGIILFLNYIPYSKHFHIVLSFPNVYYSNLDNKGRFTNMESVTQEVKLMLDPSSTPSPAASAPVGFGAKDVYDLTWKNLMDAYSCTECGRCTSVCPANQTGKLLSPRKIMMDTRDRLEEAGRNIDRNGKDFRDEKNLFSYITEEELWACTTCNACTEACPVNIDPLNIIVEMRRYLVMEQSKVPSELATMFSKIENNGAPWQFSPSDRFNWIN